MVSPPYANSTSIILSPYFALLYFYNDFASRRDGLWVDSIPLQGQGKLQIIVNLLDFLNHLYAGAATVLTKDHLPEFRGTQQNVRPLSKDPVPMDRMRLQLAAIVRGDWRAGIVIYEK